MFKDAGSTFNCILVINDIFFTMNLGDSRASGLNTY